MTGPKLRGALNDIPTYKPGKPAVGADGAPAFKLSSNENPHEPLPSVLRAMEKALRGFNRYPDMGCSALIPAVAARLGVPEAHVATGTGGVGVIQQVMQAVCDDRDQVIYPWRSFEAYPIITKMVGAHSVQVPLTPNEYQDLDAIAAAINDHTRLVILCNPNNPTGTALHRAELTEFLDRVPSDVLVLIDEAYREFVRDPEVPDGIELYRDRPNVAVLRTFSKAYGLAGLRVGYAVAHEPVADALRKMAVPFGVSQLAQDAAIASLAAEAELFERVELITKERGRVIDALRDQGWTVPASEGNFVWLRLGERTLEFAERAQAAGVMVRPFAGEGARVSIGEVDGNDLFLGVAEAFRS
ncbi:histidinol-phosphate transaminase [Kutzneria buriramensis]|uniref:Aromatic amino acid aminotransferase n=1 Tax=Kutzneria buriramensis TaxID=1045776 RepID=A0A3E0I0K7_9PSEU|nr:histidinol-phosphate transaminase [Kutzneria buriramensis]REH52242.1 histidinol-phosphate aminotransferase [Kutzneria buriramensis]